MIGERENIQNGFEKARDIFVGDIVRVFTQGDDLGELALVAEVQSTKQKGNPMISVMPISESQTVNFEQGCDFRPYMREDRHSLKGYRVRIGGGTRVKLMSVEVTEYVVGQL